MQYNWDHLLVLLSEYEAPIQFERILFRFRYM